MRAECDTRVHRLGNGLTVLVKADKAHPVVSLQYWVGTGSMNEGHLAGSGISHLLEHLVFKGTKNYSGQELAQCVQERGGHWNAYTSLNRTVYYIDGPSASWQVFLDLLTELVFEPTFPEDEFDKEKEVVRREMAMYEDDPDSVAYELMMKTLYLKHPRRWPILGELNSFNQITRQDVLEYHERRYAPNNVFLVITGDVDEAQVIEHIELLAEDYRSRVLGNESVAPESHQFGLRVARKEFAVPYSKLCLAWRLPTARHHDTPVFGALASILGGGRAAKLYEKYHDQLGLVHSIDVSANQSLTEEGTFTISMDVDRDKRDQVRDMMLEEMAQLCAGDFSEDLKRVCKQTRVSKLRKRCTASGMASEIATSWFGARNLNLAAEWQDAIERVSSEDIHRVCKEWLLSPAHTEISLDPMGSNHEECDECDQDQTPEIKEYTLENGMRLVVREDKRLPLAYACLAFKGGCPSETVENAGITDLMSECLLKGTKTRNASQIALELENLGGSIHSSTGNNSLNVGCQVLSEDLDKGLEVLADVVINPIFDEDAFLRERESFMANVEEELEDPLSVAFRAARRAAYGDESYGHSPMGTPESLMSLTVNDVKAQYERLICAQNAVLCVNGDVDGDTVFEQAKRYFDSLKAGATPDLVATPPRRSDEVYVKMDKQQAILVITVPGVSAVSDHMTEALLFQAWCGDMAGPLFTSIREECGLAYYASASLFIGLDAGGICFYLGTAPEQLELATQKLEEVLREIAQNGISPEEFERTKASVLSSRTLAMQSYGTLCQMLSLDVLFGLSAHHLFEQEHEIRDLTVEQINAFIKERLADNQPRTKVSVSPLHP